MAKAGSKKAFSLLELLMTIGLFGLLAVFITKFINSSYQLMSRLAEQGQLEDVRNMIRLRADCATSSCEQIIAKIPDKVGAWNVRGTCKEQGIYFETRAIVAPKKVANVWKPVFAVNDGFVCTPADMRASVAQTFSGGTCPPGQKVIAVDFDARTVTCQ